MAYSLNLRKKLSLLLMHILMSISIVFVFGCRMLKILGCFIFLSHLHSGFVPFTLAIVFWREYFVNGHDLFPPLSRVIVVSSYKLINIEPVLAALYILKEGFIDGLLGIGIQNVVLSHETIWTLPRFGVASTGNRLGDGLWEVSICKRRFDEFQSELASTIKLVVWEEHRCIFVSCMRAFRRFASTNNRIRWLRKSCACNTRWTLMLSLL